MLLENFSILLVGNFAAQIVQIRKKMGLDWKKSYKVRLLSETI
jgi:hypothetical protein